jgi:drug/metabolite transporter (DMT)-like permease
MVIVGSLSVAGKKVIEVFPVMLSSVLTLSLASVLMFLLHLQMVGRIRKLTKPQFNYLFLQALFGVVLFRIFFLYGLYWSSASIAGILFSFVPAMIAILSVLILREKVSMMAMAGIAMCVAGLVMCQFSEWTLTSNPLVFAGFGLLLLAMVCEALFTVLRKKLTYETLNPVSSNFYLCVIGTGLCLPFGLYDLRDFDLVTVTPIGWVPIIYTAVVVNIVSFVLWFRGVDKVDATIAGTFTVVVPVTTVILSSQFLGEPITLTMVAGMSIVIAGLLLVIIPKGKIAGRITPG